MTPHRAIDEEFLRNKDGSSVTANRILDRNGVPFGNSIPRRMMLPAFKARVPPMDFAVRFTYGYIAFATTFAITPFVLLAPGIGVIGATVVTLKS